MPSTRLAAMRGLPIADEIAVPVGHDRSDAKAGRPETVKVSGPGAGRKEGDRVRSEAATAAVASMGKASVSKNALHLLHRRRCLKYRPPLCLTRKVSIPWRDKSR